MIIYNDYNDMRVTSYGLFLAQTVGRSLSAGDYIAIRYDLQVCFFSELHI